MRRSYTKSARKVSGRFLQIEPMNPRGRIPHHGGLRRGSSFVSGFGRSLNGRWTVQNPFRRFKDALREDEAIRKTMVSIFTTRVMREISHRMA